MDEQSIFLAALEKETLEARAQWLAETCGTDHALKARIEALIERHQESSRFLEQVPADFEATMIPDKSNQDRARALQAGLAAAFADDQSVIIGHAGNSVLKSLGQSIDIRRVALRESKAEGRDPIVRPKSAEMPQRASDSRYHLDGEIARGGMGAILKGRDTDLGRDLAIKVLLDSHKDKPEVIQRFVEEAQIGGQLQHPGIAPIYELGQFADKRPFFAMKLVKGETLSKLLADREDSAADRGKFIGIFEQICQTMAYAHSRGVIHRDLKSANIMVGAFGEVQVMDWGLAKVLPAGGVADEKKAYDRQQGESIIQTLRSQPGSDVVGTLGSQTQMGSVMGTPAYMSPEQALGEIDQLDERADVFGLGAILCEILTGKPPYVADDGTRVFRMASRGKLEDCFQRLESCGADEDLVALTRHCLELDPADRPRDAGVLAERVSGYLESVETRLLEAELARAAEAARAEEALHTVAETEARTRAERRARRLQLTMAVVVAVLTTIGGLAGVWTAAEQARLKNDALVAERDANAARRKEADQRALAEAAKTRAEEEMFRAEAAQHQADAERIRSLNMLADMQTERGLQAGREGRSATAALWFANAAASTPHDLDRQRANQLRASSWLNDAIAPVALLKLPDGYERRVEFQPNGSLLLTVRGAGLRVWDWRNEVTLPWSEALVHVTDAAWSPDGNQIAVGFGTADVRIFDPVSGKERKQFRHSERVAVIEWSPSGTRLAVGGLHAQVWNVADEPVRESDWSHPQAIFGMRFNRAETRLVTSCEDKFARVFAVGDVSLPSPLYAPVEHVPNYRTSRTSAVFFDEDRRLLTVSRDSQMAVLHDATTGQPVTPAWTTSKPSAHNGFSVSPDSRWAAAAGFSSGFLFAADGRSVELKHNNHVMSVNFHPDGQSLVTTCLDGTARSWPLQELPSGGVSTGSPVTLPQQSGYATSVFSPDGTSLAISVHRQVVVWKRPQSQLVERQIPWQESFWKPRPSFDLQLVTPGIWHTASFLPSPCGGTLQVARLADGQPAGPPITLNGLLRDSCLCADHRSVAAVTVNGTTGILGIFDVPSGAPVIPLIRLPDLPFSVAARPGQPQVAVLCQNGNLLVIDTKEGLTRLDLSHDGWSERRNTCRVAYSPDGETLISVTPDNQVFVRDAQTGQLRFAPLQPVLEGGPCRAIAFSQDSRLLATAVNGRNMVQVWDLTTGEKVGRQMPHSGDVWGLWSVAFSPDGQRILTGHKDGGARLWDWKAGEVVGTPLKHPDEVYDAQFTPDGRHVVTAVRHSPPRVWDVATQKPAVPFPEIVPRGLSSNSLAIAGDRVVVTATNRYMVLDLSLLRQQPIHALTTLLTQTELATNQKLQLGELVPLEQEEWAARWEQCAAARPTPAESARLLARAFDEAESESARRAVALRAIWFNLTERLQQLRPHDPHLQAALAEELAHAGLQAELKQILPKAIATVQEALQTTPADDALQRALARMLLEDLPLTEWIPLEPRSMTAESNGTFTRQPDGSLFVEGTPAATDQYTITSHSPLRRITALQLDAIPDARLPRGGSGLHPSGSFHLTNLGARVRRKDGSTIPVGFCLASSDYIRPIIDDMTRADGPWGAIDDERSTRWDVWPYVSKPHWLTLQLREAIDLAADDELTIELEFKDGRCPNAGMGRFRLSVSNDEHAARTMILREAIRNGLFAPRESLAALSLLRSNATRALELLADNTTAESAIQSESGQQSTPHRSSTATWLLRVMAQEQLRNTDAAKAAVADMLASASRTVPRDLYGLFLDVATEIGGCTRGEVQTLLAKWDRDPELAWLTSDIEANPTDATLLSQRAAAYIATEQWDLAKADWLRAVELQPTLAQPAFDSFRLARRWSEATAFGSLLLKQTPKDSILWVKVPPIIVLAQDDAAYRAFCQGIVESYRKAPTRAAADRVVKACLLRPGAVDLAEIPGDLLDQSLNDGTMPEGLRSWGWASLALLKYRGGDAESAVKYITQAEQLTLHNHNHALNLAVLALAEHQLQHFDEARKALDEASQVIKRLQAFNRNDHDLLIAEILFREAEALMNEKRQLKESDSDEK